MKRGPKGLLASEKLARGTLQPIRGALSPDVVSVSALPQQPDWLTLPGREVWIEDIGRVSSSRLASERDSTMFANYCNLQGAIVLAWRSGQVPPAAHLMEARKMAEQFGLFGTKSRAKAAGSDGEKAANPFARNGQRG